jgi:transposase
MSFDCKKPSKANKLKAAKTFKCSNCGYAADADLNAASNLRLDLVEVPFWVRQRKLNQRGFYWEDFGLFTFGHERIVRDTKRAA